MGCWISSTKSDKGFKSDDELKYEKNMLRWKIMKQEYYIDFYKLTAINIEEYRQTKTDEDDNNFEEFDEFIKKCINKSLNKIKEYEKAIEKIN